MPGVSYLLHLGGGEVIRGERANVIALYVVAHCCIPSVRHADPRLVLIKNDLSLFVQGSALGRVGFFAVDFGLSVPGIGHCTSGRSFRRSLQLRS